MVEMVMGQQDTAQKREGGAGLGEAMNGAAAGIDQHFLAAAAQEERGRSTGWVETGAAGAQQREAWSHGHRA
jgi:hypothetical protein